MSVLEVKDLAISYSFDDGSSLHAVNGVSFELREGELLGIAGESGCGKTTILKSIMGILPPGTRIEGGILLNNRNLVDLSEKEMRKVRWDEISIVFQNAQEALNPIKKVEEQIAEPLILHHGIKKAEAINKARELLESVGVKAERGRNFPHQLSGGMKQRAIIAMALTCEPKVLLADEPTTALDVMVQAQILDLLKELKEAYSLSIIYISHDLSVLAELCTRLIIVYAGKIVEVAPTEELFKSPDHPYAQKLLQAIPTIENSSQERLPTIPGSPPRLMNPLVNCPFYERCPEAMPVCAEKIPSLVVVREDHQVACFKYEYEKNG